MKSKMAKEAMGDVSDQVTEVKGVKLIAAKVDDVDMNGLRDLGDQLKEKLGEGVIVLASAAGGKVSLVAMATDEAVKKGAHAGNLIKGIAGLVGGGGGGRPNMAQAGGKNPDGIDAAIAKVSEVWRASYRHLIRLSGVVYGAKTRTETRVKKEFGRSDSDGNRCRKRYRVWGFSLNPRLFIQRQAALLDLECMPG